MKLYHIFSRRPVASRVDFRPDIAQNAPNRQLNKLSTLLSTTTLDDQDIQNCDEGLQYLREFSYRKIFTGTTHEEFLETDRTDPQAIDWLIAVAAIDNEHYKNSKNTR